MKRGILVLAQAVISFTVCTLAYSRNNGPADMASIWRQLIESEQYDRVISSASEAYKRAVDDGDESTEICAGLYLAQAYSASAQYDSVYLYMDRIYPDIITYGSNDMKVSYYNIKAIVSANVEMDYASALESFSQALAITRKDGTMPSRERLLMCNIANLYCMRGDTLGIDYAIEAYRMSKATSDSYVLPSAVMTLIQMMMMRNDYKQASLYINELKDIYETTGNIRYMHMAYLSTAQLHSISGKNDLAQSYYDKALSLNDSVWDKSAVVSSYLDYGNFLKSTGKYQDALDKYSCGLEVAIEARRFGLLEGLYLGLSETYGILGDKDRAYEYSRQYNILEQQNAANERMFSSLVLRNERLMREKELKDKELSLTKAKERIAIATMAFLVLLVSTVSMLIMYRRKNRMYILLAESYYKLAEASAPATSKKRKTTRNEESLFQKIEHLMKEERIYRQKDVSLDGIAEALGSNRSYISKEINSCSGLSFYNYINSFRIAEAETILQDTENDITLKALCEELGFNSMSVFYSSFLKATGIPPSRYREEMRKLKAGHNSK